MSCSLCVEEAEALCNCSEALFCYDHMFIHKDETEGDHLIDVFEVEISNEESYKLNVEILGRFKQLERAKAQISAQKRILVSEIKQSGISSQVKKSVIEFKQLEVSAVKKLDFYIHQYVGLLSQGKFTLSQKKKIELLMETGLLIRKISLVKSSRSLEKILKDIVSEKTKAEVRKEERKEKERLLNKERKRQTIKKSQKILACGPEELKSNNHLEIFESESLNERIELTYYVLIKGIWSDNIEEFHQAANELLISNDGRYLFCCK